MVLTAVKITPQRSISAANPKSAAMMAAPVVAVKSSKSTMEQAVKADLWGASTRVYFFNPCLNDSARGKSVLH